MTVTAFLIPGTSTYNATARWTDGKGIGHVVNAEGRTKAEACDKVKALVKERVK